MKTTSRKVLFLLLAIAVALGLSTLFFPLEQNQRLAVRAFGTAAGITLFVGIMWLLRQIPGNPWYSGRKISWKAVALYFVFVVCLIVFSEKVSSSAASAMAIGIIAVAVAYRASARIREGISRKRVWMEIITILVFVVTVLVTTHVRNRALADGLLFLCVILILLSTFAENFRKKSW